MVECDWVDSAVKELKRWIELWADGTGRRENDKKNLQQTLWYGIKNGMS